MTDEANGLLELVKPCLREDAHIIRHEDGTEVTVVERRMVRVELQGIARFAYWWFVISSAIGLLIAITHM
jgi:hypothetical protein